VREGEKQGMRIVRKEREEDERGFQRADIQDMEQNLLKKGEGERLGVTVNTTSC
jgi:hypothetical protein